MNRPPRQSGRPAGAGRNQDALHRRLLDLAGGDGIGIPADACPPTGATSAKYHLDGCTRTLTTEAPDAEVPAGYDTGSNPAAVSFPVRFDRETVLAGYPKAHLGGGAGSR